MKHWATFAYRTIARRSGAAIFIFFIIAVAGFGLVSALEMGTGEMVNCPLQMGGTLCPMDLKHVTIWLATITSADGRFSSLLQLSFVVLFVVTLLSVLNLYWLRTRFRRTRDAWREGKGSDDRYRFGFLRAILARGILQPKIFKY